MCNEARLGLTTVNDEQYSKGKRDMVVCLSSADYWSKAHQGIKITSVTFLVAVNQTETGCLTTSKTQPLQPGILHNQTGYIYVGKCDHGALDFNISTSSMLL